MGFGNILLIVFLTYYSINLYIYFFPKNRIMLQTANIEMNKLRKIPIKNINQQKEFLKIKDPIKKFKFKKEMLPTTLIYMGCFIILYRFFSVQLILLNWNIPLWLAILIVMITPMIVNLILKKFNLQKNDISIFFK